MYCFWLPLLHLWNLLLCLHNAIFSAKLLRHVCHICGEREEELVLSSESISLCNAAQLCDGSPCLFAHQQHWVMWLCSSWTQANSQLWCLSMMCSSTFSSKNIMQGVGLGSQCPRCIYTLLVAACHGGWPNTAPAPLAGYSLATEVVSAILFCK